MRRIGLDFPGAVPAEARSIGGMEKVLDRLLCGEAVPVPLEELEMAPLAPFRCRVLAETGRIPRGKVRTYGSLAAAARPPRGGRALGGGGGGGAAWRPGHHPGGGGGTGDHGGNR